MTVTTSTTAPPGAPYTEANLRKVQTGSLTVWYYVTFTAPFDITFPNFPGFTMTLPSSIPTANRGFYIALSDPTVTNALAFRTEGPATVSGPKLTFHGSSVSVTLKAGKPYIFAFYAVVANVPQKIEHVLLISVDGMHNVDLANYIKNYPNSTLAALAKTGIRYTDAHTPLPSDSFPGLIALVTGGHPKTTGIYYDDSYDRTLLAPGSTCPGGTPGTETLYDESVDKSSANLSGGGNSDATSIDPAKLPIDPTTCAKVYPNQFLRTNTIFGVIHSSGRRTAWSDKHPAYQIVNGHDSAANVDDLYTPEINSDASAQFGVSDYTKSIEAVEYYDNLKVKAIINEINGLDHTGTTKTGIPAILGMNFQAVSVGQKLPGHGYSDAAGTPSGGLQNALDFVDASLGKMAAALDAQGIRGSTLFIVTAKHGQAPINPALTNLIADKTLPTVLNNAGATVAQATQDDVALFWLTDSTKTAQGISALAGAPSSDGVMTVFNGDVAGPAGFGTAPADSRAPDISVAVQPGVIYVGNPAKHSKIAEHGGFSDDDTHVALLLSYAGADGKEVATTVQTAQVAPTILSALGLSPSALQAVSAEGTAVLPQATFIH